MMKQNQLANEIGLMEIGQPKKKDLIEADIDATLEWL
jgi:Nucleolar protein,Nop52